MTAVYNPVATALTTVTEPVDTEPRTVASVTQMTRTLADGVAYVQGQVAVVATLAALTAIAAPADGTIRHVLGYGFYVFKTSATGGLSPFRLGADDMTIGGWLSSTAHETTRTARLWLGQRPPLVSSSGSAPAAITLASTTAVYEPATGTQIHQGPAGFKVRVATTGGTNWCFYVPIDDLLVDGAVIASATLRLRPDDSHGGLPTRQPSLSLVRAPYTVTTGGALENATPLLSTGVGHTALAAANLGAYETTNTITYTPDQNNTIDKSLYSYGAVIADEGGTNAAGQTTFSVLSINMTGIPDARRG